MESMEGLDQYISSKNQICVSIHSIPLSFCINLIVRFQALPNSAPKKATPASCPSPHPRGWKCSCLTRCLFAPGARSKEHTWHLNGMQGGLGWLLDPVRACPALPRLFPLHRACPRCKDVLHVSACQQTCPTSLLGAGKLPLCLDSREETCTERQNW